MSPEVSNDPRREACVREAVRSTQQGNDVKQNPATLKSENARQKQKDDEPDASPRPASERLAKRSAGTAKHPSVRPEVVMSAQVKDTVKKMEAMGFERHLIIQALNAAYPSPERAVEYLLFGIPEKSQAEQSSHSATSKSPNSTPRSSVAAGARVATRSTNVPAEMKKSGQASNSGTSNALQGSPMRTDVNKSGDALTLSSIHTATDMYANDKTGEAPMLESAETMNTTDESRNSPQSLQPLKGAGTTANLPNRVSLSQAQLELEMQKILPVKSGDEDVNLSDADFDRISSILCQAKREEWSFRPRTYTILRMIDAIDLLDDFVQLNCWDIALPYTKENLPQSLSIEQRDCFLKRQGSVFTKAARIEGGLTSKHANLTDNADNHLESLNELGEGGSGIVDRVRSKLSRKIYVRKRLKRKDTFEESAKALKFFANEIHLLKRLKHRHIVRYVGSYTDPNYVGIIMEPVADSDLLVFLSQTSFHQAEYDCIREAFGCLCAAIIYLQRQNCRHKDIKPENILVKQRKVYITDFGIARDWKALGKSTTTGDIGPISKSYAAPEVVAREPRNSSSDIWSLGCVYLDMIVSQPWETLRRYSFLTTV